MAYTEEQIERIAEYASNPVNLEPAGPEAWEQARRMATAIADAFTESDWTILLNRLPADRAAREIADRPVEERQFLLGLLNADQRADVGALLAATV